MSDKLSYTKKADKAVVYEELLPQIKSLLEVETDTIANMANISAVLKEAFGFFWVGFYLVKEDQLVLGPFQGNLACTRIKKGKGVCGKAWDLASIIIVPDVDQFEGHIACSSLSRSEIVVPILHNKQVVGVIDIDSDQLQDFDETDARYLEIISSFL